MDLWSLACLCFLLALQFYDEALAAAKCPPRKEQAIACRKVCENNQDCGHTKDNGNSYCACDGDCGLSCTRSTSDSCTAPLGVEFGRIPHSQMSASSVYFTREAHRSRLNFVTPWCGYFGHPRGLFIDVDFNTMLNFTAIAIQGGFDLHYKGRWPTRVFFWIADYRKWTRTGYYSLSPRTESEITTIRFRRTYIGERILMVVANGNHSDYTCARIEVYGCRA